MLTQGTEWPSHVGRYSQGVALRSSGKDLGAERVPHMSKLRFEGELDKKGCCCEAERENFFFPEIPKMNWPPQDDIFFPSGLPPHFHCPAKSDLWLRRERREPRRIREMTTRCLQDHAEYSSSFCGRCSRCIFHFWSHWSHSESH